MNENLFSNKIELILPNVYRTLNSIKRNLLRTTNDTNSAIVTHITSSSVVPVLRLSSASALHLCSIHLVCWLCSSAPLPFQCVSVWNGCSRDRMHNKNDRNHHFFFFYVLKLFIDLRNNTLIKTSLSNVTSFSFLSFIVHSISVLKANDTFVSNAFVAIIILVRLLILLKEMSHKIALDSLFTVIRLHYCHRHYRRDEENDYH